MPRSGMGGPALRWLRAAVLCGVALGTGVAAHLSAGGLMPGRPSLAVMGLAGTLLAYAVLGRPASRLRVVVLTAGGQTLTHLALTALAGHRGDPPLVRATTRPAPVPAPTGGRHGSYYDVAYAGAHQAAAPITVPAPVQRLMMDMTGQHAAMALAHLAAAAVVGLWLAGGEQALWTIVVLLVVGLRPVATVRLLVPACRPAPLLPRVARPHALPLLGSVLLARGP